MKIGMIGCGVVGSATAEYFLHKHFDVVIDDPPKFGYSNWRAILETDLLFLCLPTPTRNGNQDLSIIESTLKQLREDRYEGPVIIKSTVKPGTCARLRDHYGLRIVHNPEFLTEKSAEEDFAKQPAILVSGHRDDVVLPYALFKSGFPNLKVKLYEDFKVTELAKYMHNIHLAVRVFVSALFYETCESLDVSFKEVRDAALSQGKIGENHTNAPGIHGLGYAGMCFPDNMSSWAQFLHETKLHEVADFFDTVDRENSRLQTQNFRRSNQESSTNILETST